MIPVKKPHRITSVYGNRTSPITGKAEFHPGIDIVSDSGDHNVYAAVASCATHNTDEHAKLHGRIDEHIRDHIANK